MVNWCSDDVGEMVFDRLVAAGGFVWDHRRWGADKISVHANRGCVLDRELRQLIIENSVALKHYVFQRNDELENEWKRLGGMVGAHGFSVARGLRRLANGEVAKGWCVRNDPGG